MTVMVIASAHRVGSTWLVRMLRRYMAAPGLPVPADLRESPENRSLIDLRKPGVVGYLKSLDAPAVLKSHCPCPQDIDDIRKVSQVVYISRDPRDMAVSNASYLANLDPAKGGWSELARLNTGERIIRYLENAKYELDLMESWLAYPNKYALQYEQLLQDASGTFSRVLKDAQIDIDEARLHETIEQHRFHRLSGGRPAGQEDTGAFFRKGVAGDWRNHFTPAVKTSFQYACSARWNRNLVQSGYEASPDW